MQTLSNGNDETTVATATAYQVKLNDDVKYFENLNKDRFVYVIVGLILGTATETVTLRAYIGATSTFGDAASFHPVSSGVMSGAAASITVGPVPLEEGEFLFATIQTSGDNSTTVKKPLVCSDDVVNDSDTSPEVIVADTDLLGGATPLTVSDMNTMNKDYSHKGRY